MSAKQGRAARRRKARCWVAVIDAADHALASMTITKVEYSWGTVEYRGRLVVMTRRPSWYVAVDS